MAPQKSETIIRGLFELADVVVDGTHPWDIQVHNPESLRPCVAGIVPRAGEILYGRLVGLRGHR